MRYAVDADGLSACRVLSAAAEAARRLLGQLLDRGNGFGVVRARYNADRGAGAASAAGTAYPVHVVVGMDRYVEIVDVADLRNVEAARGDVGGDQKRDFSLAELVERRRAGRLIHVAVQRLYREAMTQ
jgi:hypothetical protein